MRVEEEAFEVTGCSAAPMTGASTRARCAREAGSAGLFHGYRFCLLVSVASSLLDGLCFLHSTVGLKHGHCPAGAVEKSIVRSVG